MSEPKEDEAKVVSSDATEKPSEGTPSAVDQVSAEPEVAPFDDDLLRKLARRAMAEAPETDATALAGEGEAPGVESGASSDEELPADAPEDMAIKSLLKKSLVDRTPIVVPDLVTGVQKKLRKRSRGKFYANSWSTTASRTSYALVAVAMLLVVAIAWLVLGPTGISIR